MPSKLRVVILLFTVFTVTSVSLAILGDHFSWLHAAFSAFFAWGLHSGREWARWWAIVGSAVSLFRSSLTAVVLLLSCIQEGDLGGWASCCAPSRLRSAPCRSSASGP